MALFLKILGGFALWAVLLVVGTIAFAMFGIYFTSRGAGAYMPSGWYGMWVIFSAWLSWWVPFKLLSHSGTEKAAETGQ